MLYLVILYSNLYQIIVNENERLENIKEFSIESKTNVQMYMKVHKSFVLSV